MGRLKPGVSFAQAKDDMGGIARRLASTFPVENAGYGILIKPVDDVFPDQRDRRFLIILMSLVGFVLLIACANVANLQLARANARTRDTATKAALGASRSVIIRQYLTESVVLGVLGGVFGLALTFVGIRILAASSTFADYWNKITLNTPVMIFTLSISVLSGIIFGIVPALRASRPNIREMLEQGGRSGGQGLAFQNFGRILVVAEVMMAVTLLTIGTGMIRNFLALRNHYPGFDTKGLVTMRVSLPAAKYGAGQFSKDQIVTIAFNQIADSIRSLPGISDVSYITVLPRNESDPRARFSIPESRQLQGGEAPIASWRAISNNYFQMMRTPLLKGRNFTNQDKFGQDAVIIISNTLARQVFPGQDPVGKQLYFFDTPRRIVGVVADVLLNRSNEPQPCIYLPHQQSPRLSMNLLVRVNGNPANVIGSIPGKVWGVDMDEPVSNLMTYESYADLQFAGRRFIANLLIVFCILALLMGAVGLYGLVNYLVIQRTKAFGIRMALGAQRSSIFAGVLKEALIMSGIGAVMGVLVLLVAGRTLASFFGDIIQWDWPTSLCVVVLLLAVSVLASLLPARRATSIEPVSALRES
jgi:putative ABC transport system permease protein